MNIRQMRRGMEIFAKYVGRDDDDNEETEEELDLDGLDSLVEELRDAAGNVEGCEFPGMFG